MENLFEALEELKSLNEAPANSNGIYSLTKGWLKEPVRDNIPDNIDLEPELTEWKEKVDKCKTIEDIDNFIDDIYKLRQEGLLKDGEYSKENLIFKEIRNLGLLQKLKDQKVDFENKEMSLESYNKLLHEDANDAHQGYTATEAAMMQKFGFTYERGNSGDGPCWKYILADKELESYFTIYRVGARYEGPYDNLNPENMWIMECDTFDKRKHQYADAGWTCKRFKSFDEFKKFIEDAFYS